MMINKLEKQIQAYNKVIVYGAGNIGKMVLKYIKKYNLNVEVKVAVTDRKPAQTLCEGYKVYSIYDLLSEKEQALVIVATLEKFQGTISAVLTELAFKNVMLVDKQLHKRLYRNITPKGKYFIECIKSAPTSLYAYLQEHLPLNEDIVFKTHTLQVDGSCETVYRELIQEKQLVNRRVIWLVSNPKDFKAQDNVIYLDVNDQKSFKAIRLLSRAKYLIWENGPIEKRRPTQKSIHITHGMPTIKNVRGIINIPPETDHVLISSENVVDLQAYQMSMDKQKYVVAGLPRLDDMFASENQIDKLGVEVLDKKVIIWMPTFRKLKNSKRNDSLKEFNLGFPLIESIEELKKLNKLLQQRNLFLIIKIHPLQELSNINLTELDNITMLTNEMMQEKDINLYKLLGETDALLTDYSSVSFDYLLLNKPIGYILDDMKEYKIGFSIRDIFRFMPGPKIMTFEELQGFFNDVADGKDNYINERNELRNYCHRYQDNKNSKRFIEKFL